MSKVAVYLYNEMVDFEVTFALHILSDKNNPKRKEIITVSEDGEPKQSRSGLRIQADYSLRQIKADEIDGLIIPGGFQLIVPEDLKTLIRSLDNQGKLLAAICAGPYYLAASGVLTDRKYTTALNKEDIEQWKLKNYFNWQNYSSADIVRDGHIITAKFNAFEEFGVEIQDWFGFFDNPEEKNWIQIFKTVQL